MLRKLFILTAVLYASISMGQETFDATAIQKIKNEGLNNSHVEKIAFELIDKAGSRLTNSEGYKRAATYAVNQLTSWGLKNAKTENWGEFGKGWEMEKSYVAMTKPYYMPFVAIPKAWTESTNGAIKGNIVVLQINSEEDFAKYQGKLKGAIVVMKSTGNQGPTFNPDATRFTTEALDKMTQPQAPRVRPTGNNSNNNARAERAKRRALSQKVGPFLLKEGAALIIHGTRGSHGTLFTSSPRAYAKDSPKGISELEMAPEYVNLMVRLSENNVPVEVEAEVKTRFNNRDLQGYNVLAEIPGTDRKLKSEVVMLGAHLDSWHGATGATDNAAGSIVMMEAVRILKTLGLQPKRTIRIALWGGEEQGLHGSRNYVKNHITDNKSPETISAYYNIDNGTGRIRGIYTQQNEKVVPIFKSWLTPFTDLINHTTVTTNNTGGTDHQAFDGVGIPGFQFIQDPIEYNTRTHHTNADFYERLVIDDLKQMAVIVATFVYNTAQRDEILPRKEVKK
ncbi:peptidase M28 [Polaribacter pacificus]|uniref:Carboxypeptidase Q n=1 Tax=Polaribacter pacificus TaxID=1775173 RepID=A0A917HY48_9FLAO|nr:M20/M25/M40 family metallo-hydrolase [Polaribacter pacificus]GGG97153.1 peptidase M28 [Polaribacter pacificus]